MKRVMAAVIGMLVILYAGTAGAHTRSESYSHWHLSGTSMTGTVTIPLREVMLLYQVAEATIPPRELFRDQLEANTAVGSAGEACTMTASNILQSASGFVRVELNFECAPGIPDTIHYRALFDVAPAHVHYARLFRDGRELGEVLITDAADTWAFTGLESGASYSFASFLAIGIGHIAGGFDHVAFLLGLLLIAGSVGRAIVAVTGFTLGHSASLAAAVLGYVHADSQLVEAFIGFTVALVAVEYFLLHRHDVTRFAVGCLVLAWLTGVVAVAMDFLGGRAIFAYAGFGVFAACYLLASRGTGEHAQRRATLLLFVATGCFGLVHGFGFAGFLMDTGLLGTSLFVPLLGFNLGVEVGQLFIVALALIAATLVRRHVPPLVPQLIAAGLCGIGVYWFIGRTLAQ